MTKGTRSIIRRKLDRSLKHTKRIDQYINYIISEFDKIERRDGFYFDFKDLKIMNAQLHKIIEMLKNNI